MTPTEAIAALVARQAEGIYVRTVPLRDGHWRCEVREQGEAWTTLHPGHPGFATFEEAVAATDLAIAGLKVARQEAGAAEVSLYLRQRRIEETTITVDAVQQVAWRAKRDDGTWAEPGVTPEAAVREARRAIEGPAPTAGDVRER